jgi:hypothetical protein
MIKGTFSVCLRRLVRGVLAWACLSASGVAAVQAQQFSADIVMRRDDVPKPMGRISVRDGKVRIETAEHPDGFFLVDTMRPSAWFVRAAARLYMDARQSSRFTRLFIPVDPDAPCRQWQAMARLAGISGEGEWRCERIGEATIGGRSTTVFRAVSDSKPIFSGWVDGARKFPLRIETDDGELMTLDQIRDEPQSASSFELPANARKFSPEALIELIKQSDVWVAAPDAESSPR